ncbi:MAG: glycosyltransferase family 2 protein [Calditerrivibrio sp.]|nr:glycosyltransferase family 2 protein [Calditerrivibrio sp.]
MYVSVVIPVYNRTGLLKSSIESVLSQNYKNFQILVIDDGSSFETFDALKPYISFIEYIKLDKNYGVSYSRNIGIKRSKYEWIAFLDSDDIWLPNKLIIQTEFMKKNNFLVSHTDEYWFKIDRFVNQRGKHSRYGGDIFDNSLDFCRISPSSVMIHRSVFDNVGLFDENLKVCEDYDLWLRITNRYVVGYLPIKTIIKISHNDPQLSLSTPHLEYYRLLSLTKFIKRNKLSYFRKKSAIMELGKKYDIVKAGIDKKVH